MPRKGKKLGAKRRAAIAAAGAAAAKAIAPRGAAAVDPEWDFGGPDFDEDAAAQEAAIEGEMPPLPPLPPRRGAVTDQPSEPSDGLVALGEPPDDPSAAMEWLHRTLVVSAKDAISDTSISAATRRRELRTIAAAARAVYPDASRWKLAQLIQADRDEVEQKRRARAGAKQAAKGAAPDSARVIPIRPTRATGE